VPRVGETLEEVDEAEPDVAVRGEIADELVEFAAVREPVVEEEIRRFLERAPLREFLDGDASVLEDALLAVDPADAGLRGGDAVEPRNVGDRRVSRGGGAGSGRLRHV
jgi:hypothetical protein